MTRITRLIVLLVSFTALSGCAGSGRTERRVWLGVNGTLAVGGMATFLLSSTCEGYATHDGCGGDQPAGEAIGLAALTIGLIGLIHWMATEPATKVPTASPPPPSPEATFRTALAGSR